MKQRAPALSGALLAALLGWPGLLLHATAAQPRYCSPEELALSADGRILYATCTETDELLAIDVEHPNAISRIAVGRKPRALAVDPRTGHLFVANSWEDTLSEVDVKALRVVRTTPTGREPTGIALDAGRREVYIANRISGDVSVVNIDSGQVFPRILVGPGASYVATAEGSGRIYVTKVYPETSARVYKETNARGDPPNAIVEIDADSRQVVARNAMPRAGAVFHVRLAPGAAMGFAAALQPKNLIPTAQVAHGGIFVNSVAVFGLHSAAVVMLPLDGIGASLAQPFDLAIAPDRSRIFVSASGADEVAVLDGRELLKAAGSEQSGKLANDLSVPTRFVLARIPVGHNPRGLVLSADGRRLYVANRLDDTVTYIDTRRNAIAGTISVGDAGPLTAERRGEQHFYSARFAFDRQFSCSSCHLDAITDGLSWDLAQDGFGLNVVSTKPLEALADTAPYKWNGTTTDLATECGQLSERYFFRSQGFRGKELSDVVSFLKSIPARPNRDRSPAGGLTPTQARGRDIFFRKQTNDGRPILPVLRCDTCHYGPASTSNQMADVGTRHLSDTSGSFDTPSLVNAGYRTSLLHDGSARTLRELWDVFNPRDLHGVTSDLSPGDLDDLVEYLKTL